MASSEILEKRRPSKGLNHRLDLHANMCAANRLMASGLGCVARSPALIMVCHESVISYNSKGSALVPPTPFLGGGAGRPEAGQGLL